MPQQSIKKKRKVRGRIDPYRVAQAKQRKSVNIARQQVLQRERKEAMGDPVRSRSTTFVESLRPGAPISILKESYLNYFVKPAEMEESVAHSRWLTEPLPPMNQSADPHVDELAKEQHEADHNNASKAMAAILELEHGSGQDRKRVNMQRCIEEFGRHNTDAVLPPKPASSQTPKMAVADGEAVIPKRVGPDTGSSEVQIAILTAKINTVSDNLHNQDKHNKRNLRLLVHKRQKLLKYMWRKERGGPRWQNLVDKLGISEAMWQQEISM